MLDAVFIPGGEPALSAPAAERFIATELARGPWDPGAQHGGAPAALLMRAFERQPAGERMVIARVTYELMRPVPMGPLDVQAEIVRSGRRVQLLEATLRTDDGTEVVRARALKVQRSDAPGRAGGDPQSPADTPADGRLVDFPSNGRRMFSSDALEIRFTSGAFLEPGPATAWFRLRHPLVAGEDPSPLQRLAAAADFGNGISSLLPWDEFIFINPDLTIYLERDPVGEWIRLDSSTRVGRDGIGLSESRLGDAGGPVGRATQALLITRRRIDAVT